MKYAALLIGLFVSFSSFSQHYQSQNSSEIYQGIEKLNTVGTVLYLAAHPDDENTRLIAYLANKRMVRTGYLSLTRGDGGQNLIGTEKGAALGLIRTQELLAARRIDGGEQFFTRAVDFGYSKTADETLKLWDKELVLGDVVRVIRQFRPDVIVTRFPPDKRAGHGHHTTSALLAQEAFHLAADSSAYPEQLDVLSTWQAKRLLLNTGRWWHKDIEKKAKESDEYVTVDIGDYSRLLGKSYREIASISRSSHSSQGFGSIQSRGSHIEYLKHTSGEKAESDLLDQIDLSWNRLEEGKQIGEQINALLKEYNFQDPSASVPQLLEIRSLIEKISSKHWKKQKLKEIDKLIQSSLGLWLEALPISHSTSSGDSIKIEFSALQRSSHDVQLKKISFLSQEKVISEQLKNNQSWNWKTSIKIPSDQITTPPYWLKKSHQYTFQVDRDDLIGTPENSPIYTAIFTIDVKGQQIQFESPFEYRWEDDAKGEFYRPFNIVPSLTANFDQKVYVLSGKSQAISVIVKAHSKHSNSKIVLNVPEGWSVSPDHHSLEKIIPGTELAFQFQVTPPNQQQIGKVSLEISSDVGSHSSGYQSINYDHIPHQVLLPKAEATLANINVSIKGKKIGYIRGAGDEVPEGLEQMGYDVEIISAENLSTIDLTSFDAIVLGIRSFNKSASLQANHSFLMKYVKNGGTLVTQYVTSWGLKFKDFTPYKSFKLGRERVTDEFATPTFIDPSHPILSSPNKITKSDFDHWVQERGLYFASEWGNEFQPIISWNDPGEETLKGALLVSDYGKGKFIYTGISFFRQLPAGVPGAFKLLANIVSYGKE